MNKNVTQISCFAERIQTFTRYSSTSENKEFKLLESACKKRSPV